jgi:hypothetical protein
MGCTPIDVDVGRYRIVIADAALVRFGRGRVCFESAHPGFERVTSGNIKATRKSCRIASASLIRAETLGVP